MLNTPWPIVIAVIALVAWAASRSIRVVAGSVIILLAIGYFGMWEDTMRTISMILVCTVLSVVIGIPIGIVMSRSAHVQNFVNPILDVMQTMPSFVYLIPVVMLLGIGKVPGLIAVVIYALPPMVRLTNLGIRLVDRDVLEAADAFGSSNWQKLRNVQLPLAMPTIMAGINQTIMMALTMVVIASMIGVRDLAIRCQGNRQLIFPLGIFNGLHHLGIAIIFDRIEPEAFGLRLQRHSGDSVHVADRIGHGIEISIFTKSPATGDPPCRRRQGGMPHRAHEQHSHVLGLKTSTSQCPAAAVNVIMGLPGPENRLDPACQPADRFHGCGEVLVDGIDVVKMKQRDSASVRPPQTAMVFQKFALLPHRTVLDNAVYGLKFRASRANGKSRTRCSGSSEWGSAAIRTDIPINCRRDAAARRLRAL